MNTSATVSLIELVVGLQISARYTSSTVATICWTRDFSTPVNLRNRLTSLVCAIIMFEFMWSVVPYDIMIGPGLVCYTKGVFKMTAY